MFSRGKLRSKSSRGLGATKDKHRKLRYSVVCGRTTPGLKAVKVVDFTDGAGYTRRQSVVLAEIDVPMTLKACQGLMTRLRKSGVRTEKQAFDELSKKYPVITKRRTAR